MNKLTAYLKSRLTSEVAVIGMIFLILEVALHLAGASTIIIMVCLAMIVFPEATVKAWLASQVDKIKS